MKKKAQGISITTIIVAAIALIVLVVLVAIFTGRMGIWGQGLDSAGKGTYCQGSTAPASSEPVSIAGGTWRTKCEANEDAIYGIFLDQKDNPGQSCCKENT